MSQPKQAVSAGWVLSQARAGLLRPLKHCLCLGLLLPLMAAAQDPFDHASEGQTLELVKKLSDRGLTSRALQLMDRMTITDQNRVPLQLLKADIARKNGQEKEARSVIKELENNLEGLPPEQQVQILHSIAETSYKEKNWQAGYERSQKVVALFQQYAASGELEQVMQQVAESEFYQAVCQFKLGGDLVKEAADNLENFIWAFEPEEGTPPLLVLEAYLWFYQALLALPKDDQQSDPEDIKSQLEAHLKSLPSALQHTQNTVVMQSDLLRLHTEQLADNKAGESELNKALKDFVAYNKRLPSQPPVFLSDRVLKIYGDTLVWLFDHPYASTLRSFKAEKRKSWSREVAALFSSDCPEDYRQDILERISGEKKAVTLAIDEAPFFNKDSASQRAQARRGALAWLEDFRAKQDPQTARLHFLVAVSWFHDANVTQKSKDDAERQKAPFAYMAASQNFRVAAALEKDASQRAYYASVAFKAASLHRQAKKAVQQGVSEIETALFAELEKSLIDSGAIDPKELSTLAYDLSGRFLSLGRKERSRAMRAIDELEQVQDDQQSEQLVKNLKKSLARAVEYLMQTQKLLALIDPNDIQEQKPRIHNIAHNAFSASFRLFELGNKLMDAPHIDRQLKKHFSQWAQSESKQDLFARVAQDYETANDLLQQVIALPDLEGDLQEERQNLKRNALKNFTRSAIPMAQTYLAFHQPEKALKVLKEFNTWVKSGQVSRQDLAEELKITPFLQCKALVSTLSFQQAHQVLKGIVIAKKPDTSQVKVAKAVRHLVNGLKALQRSHQTIQTIDQQGLPVTDNKHISDLLKQGIINAIEHDYVTKIPAPLRLWHLKRPQLDDSEKNMLQEWNKWLAKEVKLTPLSARSLVESFIIDEEWTDALELVRKIDVEFPNPRGDDKFHIYAVKKKLPLILERVNTVESLEELITHLKKRPVTANTLKHMIRVYENKAQKLEPGQERDQAYFNALNAAITLGKGRDADPDDLFWFSKSETLRLRLAHGTPSSLAKTGPFIVKNLGSWLTNPDYQSAALTHQFTELIQKALPHAGDHQTAMAAILKHLEDHAASQQDSEPPSEEGSLG